MIKYVFLSIITVGSFLVSALPPEWPEQFGDRDAIHAQLKQFEPQIHKRLAAKLRIKQLAQNPRENLEALVENTKILCAVDQKEEQSLRVNLQKNCPETLTLLIDGINIDIGIYTELLKRCRGSQKEDSSQSVFCFFELLFFSKGQYQFEHDDMLKRDVGAIGRLPVPADYIDADRKFYQAIYTSLWEFVKMNTPEAVKRVIDRQPKKQSEFKPFITSFKEQFEASKAKQQLHTPAAKKRLSREESDRLLQLETLISEGTPFILYSKLTSETTKTVSVRSDDVFSAYMANFVLEEMLRPLYQKMTDYHSQLRKTGTVAKLYPIELYNGQLMSADTADANFSLLAYAQKKGIARLPKTPVAQTDSGVIVAKGTKAASDTGLAIGTEASSDTGSDTPPLESSDESSEESSDDEAV